MNGKIRTGWVYVLSNESLLGQVKVGFTSGHPEERAKELEGTSIPTPFIVETAFLFQDNAYQIELLAHDLLGDFRVSSNREFFRCDAKIAAEAILKASSQLNEKPTTVSPVLLTSEEIAERKRHRDREEARVKEEKLKERLREEKLREERLRQELLREERGREERLREETLRINEAKVRRIELEGKAIAGDFQAQLVIAYFWSSMGTIGDEYGSEWWRNPDRLTDGEFELEFINRIEEDPRIVFRHFRDEIRKDHTYWAVNLGQCYALGYGVGVNPKKAFFW
ncbi:MAG: GIY-YIG nuclease family protein, partial [Akkermansiaceae bacterium]|nr:GIY-YIG nuclease family protein [Akkermansiaceae bacterium]